MPPKEAKSPKPSTAESTPTEATSSLLPEYMKHWEEQRQETTERKQEIDLITQTLQDLLLHLYQHLNKLSRLHRSLTRLRRP